MFFAHSGHIEAKSNLTQTTTDSIDYQYKFEFDKLKIKRCRWLSINQQKVELQKEFQFIDM